MTESDADLLALADLIGGIVANGVVDSDREATLTRIRATDTAARAATASREIPTPTTNR